MLSYDHINKPLDEGRRANLDLIMIIKLVLKAVALAMGIASIVLGFFPKESDLKTRLTLLSIGLTALAFDLLLLE